MHDDFNRDFTIFETFDHSLIGVYPVTISVSIEVPDDYTKTTFTTHNREQTFNIYVEPCQITSIVVINPLGDYFYQIGSDPELITDPYEFEYQPDCQYTMIY